jgi:hypothetical protein
MMATALTTSNPVNRCDIDASNTHILHGVMAGAGGVCQRENRVGGDGWWVGTHPTAVGVGGQCFGRRLKGVGVNPDLRADHLIFLPAIVVASLPALELAVARTLTTSFLGFLVSLLPLFFSLDMGVSFRIEAAKADAGAVVARGFSARQGA